MTEIILEEINYKFICKCSNENKTLNNNKGQNAGGGKITQLKSQGEVLWGNLEPRTFC